MKSCNMIKYWCVTINIKVHLISEDEIVHLISKDGVSSAKP